MCRACFENNKIITTTSFTVDNGSCLIIFKNVPCLECRLCGDVTFTDQISARLEELVNEVRSMDQEISIIDFTKVARKSKRRNN